MHLFVYGTLLSNIPSSMSKFLSRRATLIGKAITKGSLYDLGMYPGFVAGGEETVTGELYHLNSDKQVQTLEMLDAYESVTGEPDDQYRRLEISVQVSGGGNFKAETYEFTGETEGMQLIHRGDYTKYYHGKPDHERFVNGE
ncbi:gamma-glutamylcyclotransferase family protein [Neolewinella persica]|uniref:gamma-glutamylcyclotransferase family protein n=1 Tax=Neolewinella persica TaxID=70998 RepID=UPI00037913EA|nr:gamma-glutamylcyclotransferase family protein [Neolewinella persica]